MPTDHRRLCRGLALIPTDDRLIVLGAPHRQVFSGGAATTVLPGLLGLLDGSRDRDQIAAELDLDTAQVSAVLALLTERGLLESATAPTSRTAPAEQVTTYLSRNMAASGTYTGTGELVDALATAAVYVAGDERVAAAVAADLRDCGIAAVGAGAGVPGESFARRLAQAARPLVVAVDSGPSAEFLRAILSWCDQRGIPVLRMAATGGYLEAGPCFLAGGPACVDCLHAGRSDAGWQPAEPGPADAAGADRDAADALAGLAGAEALRIVAGLPGGRLPYVIARIGLDEWTTDERMVLPDPDCATCRPGHGPQPTDPDTWLVECYEQVMRAVPQPLTARTALSPAQRAHVRDLQSQRPAFATHPRLPLDGPDPADGAAPPASAPVNLRTLAGVLRKVAGLRHGPGERDSQRWAPTGGELASVELYLITASELPGLPGTVFRYADLTHELIAVRPDPVTLPDALAGTDLAGTDPGGQPAAAALVLVAARARLAGKYDTFAHRLSHLDAGCATTQLAVVAAHHGLTVTFGSAWDERLAQLLELLPDEQFVTALATLGPTPGGA